jgi:hypothetical protein
MATKRSVTTRAADKRRQARAVLALSRRTEAEVKKLLKQSQAGTIASVDLNTGLKEVDRRLRRMMVHIQNIL